ncbi:hypothetical protein FS594_08735 [Rahnella aquatilis]|nr:hypothetical protein FS594_08735 [Rahnella aquatilis]
MSIEEPTDLKILQRRVGSAEILLTLISQQLTDEQKQSIEVVLNKKLEGWKGKGIVEDLFDGAKHLLNKEV